MAIVSTEAGARASEGTGTATGTGSGIGTGPGTGTGTHAVVPNPARGPVVDRARARIARLRRGLRTPPGRLRVAGAVLALLALVFGAVAAWQVNTRARAADRLVSDTGPLSQDAAEIYRSLADADTTAAGGFLLAANEPASVRERYDRDLATAAELLTRAAARTSGSSDSQQWIAALNRQLPQYAGLVDRARTYNRQGYPLGGAYLRYASTLMQTAILPDAQRLVDSEADRLRADYRKAEAFPWAAAALAGTALAALGWYQVVLFRRTNRVFNLGLAGATLAVLVSALWVVVGVAGAASSLRDSRTHGAEPLRALDQARIDALQAHAAENLHLVARGSSTAYAANWAAEHLELSGRPGGPVGSLTEAQARGSGDAAALLTQARLRLVEWQQRHEDAAKTEDNGDFDGALRLTISADADAATADAAFAAMDAQLALAAETEKRAFADAARDVDGDLRLIALGAAVLAVPAVVGVAWGIGRRLGDYRF